MAYEINGFHKMAELDNWEEGVQFEYGYSTWIDCHISADTVSELQSKIIVFLDVDAGAITLDACEEAGRIDVQKTENADGYSPTASETEYWKAGIIGLYCVTYSCYVEKVTRETVALTGG